MWARGLTRRDVFEALAARRTYALTGARIVLETTVNGAPMGSEIELTNERRVEARVRAPGEIEKVEFMKNAALAHVERPGSDEAALAWEDEADLDQPAFYYVRVTQTDGELAVASPVWVG